jgi:hypothetical protein
MQTSQTQMMLNKDAAQSQAEINMVNQNTPYGSLNYTQSGTASDGTPMFTATTNLSPRVQALVDKGIANDQGAANTEGNLLTNFGSSIAAGPNTGWSDTEANIDRLALNTINPQIAHQDAALDQSLADKGITPGSEQWNYAKGAQSLSDNQARDQLYLNGNQQAYTQNMQNWQAPINALNALKSGAQLSQPSLGLVQTPQESISAPNYMQAVQQNYQDQLQSSQASMGGLFGLGGSLLGGVGQMFGMR